MDDAVQRIYDQRYEAEQRKAAARFAEWREYYADQGDDYVEDEDEDE